MLYKSPRCAKKENSHRVKRFGSSVELALSCRRWSVDNMKKD